MAVFLLPLFVTGEKTGHVNCSRAAAAHTLQYSTCRFTGLSVQLAQGARQTALQWTWRLVPAGQKQAMFRAGCNAAVLRRVSQPRVN
jgi:hypothetical protein